ncbi:MAG: flagellar hook-length control protein FliK, partial [bacterium]
NTFTKMMAGELKEAQTGQPGKETLTHPGKPETDESGKAGRNPLLKPGESVNGDLTQRFDASLVRGLNTATVAKTGIKFQEKGIAELSRLSSLESDIGKNSGNRPTARIASLSNIAGENSLANRGAQGGLKAETTAGKASTPVNIKDVVGRVKIMISSKTNEMVMKLSPEHLGKLEIQLKKEGDKMIGRFTVDNLQAKKALEAELPQLKHALTEQGIHIEEFTVTLNSDDGSNSSFAFNHREGGDTGHSRDTGAMDNETRSGSPVAGNKGSSIQRNASGLNIYV